MRRLGPPLATKHRDSYSAMISLTIAQDLDRIAALARHTVMVVPVGQASSTAMVPWWALMTTRTMHSPRPVPATVVWRALAAR